MSNGHNMPPHPPAVPTRHPSAVSAVSTLPPPSRLLLPRVRPTHPTTASPRLPSRLSRARSPSLPQSSVTLITPDLHHATALEWLGLPLNFDVVQDQLEIEGYQMYAVEKWIVERNRPITVLTVYTGDPSHKITVTALAPSSSLQEKEAASQWEQALLHLRRDASARPKKTDYGVLMSTSLAYFRSDYTIVHIPHGNFLLAKDQLYANINLLRLGCGGRSALSLEEPSDTTKDRFITTYHIPEITLPSTLPLPLHHHSHLTSSDHLPLSPQPVSTSASLTSKDPHLASPTPRPSHHRSRSHSSPRSSLSKNSAHPSIHVVGPTPTSSVRGGDSRQSGAGSFSSLGHSTLTLLAAHTKGKTKDYPFFNATVLELVKLVQTGLALFGMYDVKGGLSYTGGLLIDGLLCDVTVRGIERWITEIGEPRAGLEPAERIVDPMFVSALISLVLSVRNKLSTLGYSNAFPKDPFLHPQAFTVALSSYASSTVLPCVSPNSPLTTPVPPISTYVAGHNLPVAVTTAPFTAAAFLNPGNSLSSPPPSGLPTANSSANATQVHLPSVPTAATLTKELVESIEAAYAKRVASMNDGDNLSMSAGPGSGVIGLGGGAGGSTPTLNLRDSAAGGGGGGGTHTPGGSGHTRRKVKRVLKGKLEDLTSVVANPGEKDFDTGVGDGGRDDRGAGGLSGGEGDGNVSVGSSGGQLLRGVGNLLLSGASGIAGSTGNTNAALSIWDVNVDLENFALSIIEREGGRRVKTRRKKGAKASESGDFGNLALALGNSYNSRSNAALPLYLVSGDHGIIVSMLWSGRIADVVALREWERERERLENIGGLGSPGGVASDGEEARSDGVTGRSTEGEDSDLQTEGRSVGGSFGGVWSEKMQRRLGNWAGLARKKGQGVVDVVPTMGSIGRQAKSLNRFPPHSRSPNSKKLDGETKGGIQSPTLDPSLFSGDLERDEILLDSGQVSPSSDYRSNPFTLENPSHSSRGTQLQFYDNSRGASAAELGRSGSSNVDHGIHDPKPQSTDLPADAPLLGAPFELDTEKSKSYSKLSMDQWRSRPVHQQRIASWSDTRSAWADEGFWMGGKHAKGRKRKRPGLTRVNTTLEDTMEEEDGEDGEGDEVLDQREVESDIDGWREKKTLGIRRRSYHDLDSFRSVNVLSPQRMRIDVELCGQVLIMMRREEHLRNVIACLEALTSTLGTTNTLLQDDFEQHRDALLEIERRAKVISEIEGQLYKANQTGQAKNMLQYESAQFLISELWHMASLSRNKVFELREKVFGAGGRRLPTGKHGAHGNFNRVQWTLDGERRLVDYLGRTEEEVEEEDRVDIPGVAIHPPPPEGEDTDVVEHPSIKPMWLLRFFTTWGARWSALRVGGAQSTSQENKQEGTATGDKDTAAAESREETTGNVE